MSTAVPTSTRLAALLVAALLTVACDGEPQPEDAEIGRDAQVSDSGGLLDAGPSADDGGQLADAGLPDAAPLCQWDLCDPRAASGCTSGQCVLWSEETTCEDEPGMLGRDVDCTEVGQCAPGLACFRVEGVGRCGRICCPGDGDACMEGESCGGSGILVDGTETRWGRCLDVRDCDVHAPETECEDREGCYIIDLDGTTECRVAGTAEGSDPCEVQEDCAAGFFCGGLTGLKRCVRICRLGMDDCRGLGEGCVAQAHTPPGSGLCTVDSSSNQRR